MALSPSWFRKRRLRRAKLKTTHLITAQSSTYEHGFLVQNPTRLADQIATGLPRWIRRQSSPDRLRRLIESVIRRRHLANHDGQPPSRGFALAGTPAQLTQQIFEHLFGIVGAD